MGLYSKNCLDANTHWDEVERLCVMCNFPRTPGYELSPNCGFSDEGDRHESPYRSCPPHTFNDGSYERCQRCEAACPTLGVSFCNSSIVQCVRENVTVVTSFQESSLSPAATPTPVAPFTDATGHGVQWAVSIFLICLVVAILSGLYIYWKRRAQRRFFLTCIASPQLNEGFTVFPFTPDGNGPEEPKRDAEILSKPLQSLMDDLDVVEELVMLLDPDSPGVKNTRHLASLCSFSSPWINYTYSMKDSRSPLKAVLEGIISRHPDWTVGHLCRLLSIMERNDAVVALTKLRINDVAV